MTASASASPIAWLPPWPWSGGPADAKVRVPTLSRAIVRLPLRRASAEGPGFGTSAARQSGQATTVQLPQKRKKQSCALLTAINFDCAGRVDWWMASASAASR